MLHFGKAQPALLCQESDLGAGAHNVALAGVVGDAGALAVGGRSGSCG